MLFTNSYIFRSSKKFLFEFNFLILLHKILLELKYFYTLSQFFKIQIFLFEFKYFYFLRQNFIRTQIFLYLSDCNGTRT